MSRVVVIGAGVVGAAISRELCRRGADVVLLDRGEPGSGTSRSTFAMDITARKTPQEYFDLSLRAGARHAALAAEISADGGTPAWLHPAPSIEIEESPNGREVVRQRLERVNAWGYRGEIVSLSDLNDEYPTLDFHGLDTETAVVYHDAAWYDAAAFVSTTLRDAKVRAHTDTPVLALERRGDDGWTVRTPGRDWEADWVVNCAGPDAATVAGLAGLTLALQRVPGVIAQTASLGDGVPTPIVTLWSINFRPTVDGGLCLHSYPVDAHVADHTTRNNALAPDEITRRLHEMAARLVPALCHLPTDTTSARIGIRPVPSDGLPLVGVHPAAPGLYHVVTHSAIHLAPMLAQLAAEEIATGRSEPVLAPFRPDRTVGSAADESMQEMLRTYTTSIGLPPIGR